MSERGESHAKQVIQSAFDWKNVIVTMIFVTVPPHLVSHLILRRWCLLRCYSLLRSPTVCQLLRDRKPSLKTSEIEASGLSLFLLFFSTQTTFPCCFPFTVVVCLSMVMVSSARLPVSFSFLYSPIFHLWLSLLLYIKSQTSAYKKAEER